MFFFLCFPGHARVGERGGESEREREREREREVQPDNKR